MTDDLMFKYAARALLRRHGGDAALEAARRGATRLSDGQTDAAATWFEIAYAVQTIEASLRVGTPGPHLPAAP